MEQKYTVYTYGNIKIQATELICLLHKHNINCVVDCRMSNDFDTISTPTCTLASELRQQGIYFLPFYNHFGRTPENATDKNDNMVYEKYIHNEDFTEGIKRLINGINKGYRICIIDNCADITKSRLFLILGRNLQKYYNVIHILSEDSVLSQSQIENRIKAYEISLQKNNEKAKILGQAGEELATEYLINNGYRIIDRNWNLHKGCELDIVAMKSFKLHFIEVKTRSSAKYGEPEQAITFQKLININKAIRTYRHDKKFFKIDYQIDSIAIIYTSPNNYTLKHFLNITTSDQPCDEIITYTS